MWDLLGAACCPEAAGGAAMAGGLGRRKLVGLVRFSSEGCTFLNAAQAQTQTQPRNRIELNILNRPASTNCFNSSRDKAKAGGRHTDPTYFTSNPKRSPDIPNLAIFCRASAACISISATISRRRCASCAACSACACACMSL